MTVAASATDTAIQQKISDEEMEDIMKIIKSLKKSALLIKGASETIKNEAKEQKDGFLDMLLGILGANLLKNLLTGKEVMRAGEGKLELVKVQIELVRIFNAA